MRWEWPLLGLYLWVGPNLQINACTTTDFPCGQCVEGVWRYGLCQYPQCWTEEENIFWALYFYLFGDPALASQLAGCSPV